jgi:hypothetical protein
MNDNVSTTETPEWSAPLVGEMVRLVLRPSNHARYWDVVAIAGDREEFVVVGESRDDPVGTIAEALCHGKVPEGISQLAFCRAVLKLHAALLTTGETK